MHYRSETESERDLDGIDVVSFLYFDKNRLEWKKCKIRGYLFLIILFDWKSSLGFKLNLTLPMCIQNQIRGNCG